MAAGYTLLPFLKGSHAAAAQLPVSASRGSSTMSTLSSSVRAQDPRICVHRFPVWPAVRELDQKYVNNVKNCFAFFSVFKSDLHILFYMKVLNIHVFRYITCMLGSQEGQKRAFGSLELKVQIIVSHLPCE